MKKLPRLSSEARQFQSGQALLIVLLSMAVVLTVVLSILSFSITDVAVSSREEEALRAFSAAEAGIERALLAGTGLAGSFEQAAFEAAVTSVAEGSNVFIYPQDVAIGDVATIWFVAHNATNQLECSGELPCFTGSQLRLCWGKAGTGSGSATAPAIETSIFYLTVPGDYTTARIARVALDPNAARRATNGFESPDGGGCTLEGKNFAFQKTIDFNAIGVPSATYGSQDGLQYMTVRLLYNSDITHDFGVDVNFAGAGLLPSQGNKVVSTGTAGEATRKVEVFRMFSNLPTAFNSVLFTSGGITK